MTQKPQSSAELWAETVLADAQNEQPPATTEPRVVRPESEKDTGQSPPEDIQGATADGTAVATTTTVGDKGGTG